MEFLGDLLKSFIFKFADVMLGTAKTIYLAKMRYVVGALLSSVSCFFYLKAMVIATNADNDFSIYMMCLATFIGTLIPAFLIKKAEPEKLYVFNITATSVETGKEMIKALSDSEMSFKTEMSKNNDNQNTLTIVAYCSTKEQSRKVLSLMPDDFKYHAYAAQAVSEARK